MNNLKFDFALIIVLFLILLFLPVSKKEPPAAIETKNQPPQVDAKAALAEDFLSGEVLFSKNPRTPMPLASFTKIISGLVVLDFVNLNNEVEITKSAVLAPEPSSLRVGEHLKAKDLLAMAMVESSNDAITALFEHTKLTKDNFLNLMRQKAAALGAESMNFNNVTGYDLSPTIAGGYGSAEDLLKVAKASLASPLWQFGGVSEVVSSEGIHHVLKPTNALGPELTPLLGSKTGYTDLAGGNLLIIVEYPIGRPLGIVVLGSTERGRFEDARKIFEWVKTGVGY